VETVERALSLYGAPVFVRKQIVHNAHVVRELEERGAVFVEDETQAPPGAILVLSAHGVAPSVYERAASRGQTTIDASCPFVTNGHGQPGSYGPGGGYGGYGAPPPPDYIQQGPGRRPGRARTLLTYAVVAALAAGVGAGTVLLANNNSKSGDQVAGQPFRQRGTSSGQGAGTGLSSSTEQAIVNKIEPGLVDITSSLRYSGGTAEATGMVISSSGLVLTNNHVIDGSTRLTATLVGSGRHYEATVVGYDKSNDVAVLKLTGASGLRTVPIGDSSKVKMGDVVVALGNADGQGGAPPFIGSITGLNETITASDEGSANGRETLHGMLQTNAQIVPGDSGGPLANINGQVIGMNTAAATGTFGSGPNVGFAIPSNRAMTIARLISSGKGSPTIKLGLSGFMGVLVPGDNARTVTSPQRQRTLQLQQNNQAGTGTGGTQGCLITDQNMGIPAKVAPVKAGALVDGVLCKTAADDAGLGSGDVITSVDGHPVTSPLSLTNTMTQYRPGQQVIVNWVDPSGAKHSTSVTLSAAPPQ